MARDLTAAEQAESAKVHQRVVLLLYMDFPGDQVTVWDGIGPITWGGETWQGTGDLGSIDVVSETIGLEAKKLNLTISGVPSANIALARGQQYQGRDCILYFGHRDAAGDIIPDPWPLFSGYMEQMALDEQGELSQITVSAVSELADGDRALETLYDDQQQRSLFPDDPGFKFALALQEKEVPWGVGAGGANAPRRIRAPGAGGGAGGGPL